ncbi:MAG TPA: NAD(P)H-dependent oxidoreductase [Chloroflexota bacterium]|nr:NAD(P)H-dependent oxidoreductase [Chloroflexota bacterium]
MTGLRAIGLSGSISSPSRSGALVNDLLERLAARNIDTELIDLARLSADGLLYRTKDAEVAAALERVTNVPILLVGTPIYRASYTGQLKAFFDLMPRDALHGTIAGLIATGASPAHLLAVDHGLRPLVASLAGLSAARAIYATDPELGGYPTDPLPAELGAQLDALSEELLAHAQQD